MHTVALAAEKIRPDYHIQ